MIDATTYLAQIHSTQSIETPMGNIPLHSGISASEGKFIEKLIVNNQFCHTIEIGCAYGISTLHIIAALQQQQKSVHHTIIDPYQHSQWQGIGVQHVQQVGFDTYQFIEQPSELALPTLLAANKQFDFALIDGWHTFDQVMLDFYYLNRMLNMGGIIVFDDVWMPSVCKALAYILHYPGYQLADAVPYTHIKHSFFAKQAKRIVYGSIKNAKALQQILPERWVANAKYRFDLYGMVAIQKIAPDNRSWDWYQPF